MFFDKILFVCSKNIKHFKFFSLTLPAAQQLILFLLRKCKFVSFFFCLFELMKQDMDSQLTEFLFFQQTALLLFFGLVLVIYFLIHFKLFSIKVKVECLFDIIWLNFIGLCHSPFYNIICRITSSTDKEIVMKIVGDVRLSFSG